MLCVSRIRLNELKIRLKRTKPRIRTKWTSENKHFYIFIM